MLRLRRLVIGGVATALIISVSQPQMATAAKRWYYLAERPQLQPFGSVYTGLVHIDGRTYARSVYHYVSWGGGEASVQFDLRRRCDRLRYVAGVTDDSPPEAADEFRVYGGSRLLRKHQLGFGEHARRSVSVKRVLRLKLDVIGVGENGGYAAWGNAKIRCTRL